MAVASTAEPKVPAETSSEAVSVHNEATLVDCHNDFIILVDRDLARGITDPLGSRWIPQLRKGGVDVQVAPIFVEEAYLPEGALRRTLLLIETLHRQIQQNPNDAQLALTGEDISDAVGKGKIAFILALEGSPAIAADVDLVETFFRLGVRMASFSWFGRTQLADGSAEEGASNRLTKAGVRCLEEMERLGMLMDVSHLSAANVDHVLEVATRPIIASHSSAKAILDHHRNLSDDHLRAIAETGGVIGVNFFHAFVDPENPTLDRLVDHIEHIAEVAGIDHVGIGPDFVKEYFDEFYPNDPDLMVEGVLAKATIKGMETSADLPLLTQTMLDRGFDTGGVMKVLGDNFLRVFSDVMGVTGG
jgi:membrane dipeptidase